MSTKFNSFGARNYLNENFCSVRKSAVASALVMLQKRSRYGDALFDHAQAPRLSGFFDGRGTEGRRGTLP